MLKYTFSLLLVLGAFFGQAQETKTPEVTVKDSIKPKTEKYGLRVGVDLSKIARSLYEKDYQGLELVGDFKFARKYYLAAEIGNENKTVDDEQLNFTTKGTYLKIGGDYNLYENWTGMHNMIYLGMRYGISSFSQNLNSYSIYTAYNYFPKPVVEANQKFDGLSAQWLELVAGIKAEIFTNFYMGFSVRANLLLTQKKPENFDNLYIPGFNRTSDGSFGAGFNYTISYFLPLYKSTVKAKEEEKEKKKKK